MILTAGELLQTQMGQQVRFPWRSSQSAFPIGLKTRQSARPQAGSLSLNAGFSLPAAVP